MRKKAALMGIGIHIITGFTFIIIVGSNSLIKILMAGIISLIISLGIILVSRNRIFKPLKEIEIYSKNIRSGNNFLNEGIKTNLRTGEFKEIYTTYDLLIMEIEGLRLENKNISYKSTEGHNLAREQLLEIIKKADIVSEDIKNLTSNINTTILLNSNMEKGNKNIKDVVDELEVEIKSIINASNELRGTTDEISKKLNESQLGFTGIYESAKHGIDDALESSKQVDKINDLTQAILDIASKTQLLALNASIEAARAGESGQGFAVVASEIGELAEYSTKTAKEIKDVTEGISDAVNKVIHGSEKVLDFIEKVDTTHIMNSLILDMNEYVRKGIEMNKAIVSISTVADKVDELVSTLEKIGDDIKTNMEESNMFTEKIISENNEISEIILKIEAQVKDK